MPRCKICKSKFESKYFNQKTCFEPKCLIEWKDKVKSKEWSKEKKKIKESLKTLNDYYQDALKVFNTYIRERDKLNTCISCDAIAGTYKLTSGHYYPQGQYKSVALDEDNAHSQCWYNCNCMKSGNLIPYRKNLIKKIGLKRFEKLEQKANETKKFTKEELIELKQFYKEKIKSLGN